MRFFSLSCNYRVLCVGKALVGSGTGTFVFARHVSVAWVGSQVVGTQVLIDLCQHCHGHIVIYDLLVAFVGHLHMHVTASLSNITCFPGSAGTPNLLALNRSPALSLARVFSQHSVQVNGLLQGLFYGWLDGECFVCAPRVV